MKHRLLFIWLTFSFSTLHSQSGFFNEPIFKISVFSHSIGMPFKDYVKKPLNLGISIGAQFAYNKEKQNSLLQEFELSWFKHRHVNKALMIKTNISKNYFTNGGLYIAPELGIGYIMDITENASYKFNESGNYERASGISHGFVTQLSITAGKRFKRAGQNDFSTFIKYEGLVQLPYSDFIPFLPQTMLHIGSKIFVTENN